MTGHHGARWAKKGCFDGLGPFGHLVSCGLHSLSWAVLSCSAMPLRTGSLGHGDTDWLLFGLVFQEIDKMGRIKPAMNSWH